MSRYSIKDIDGLKNFYSEQFVRIVSNQLRISMLEATVRISELTKYLAIVAAAKANDPKVHYSPPVNLDQVWHVWLKPENRQSYDEFCDKYLGRRVEHTPMPVQPRGNLEDVARELDLKLNQFAWYSGDDDGDCG